MILPDLSLVVLEILKQVENRQGQLHGIEAEASSSSSATSERSTRWYYKDSRSGPLELDGTPNMSQINPKLSQFNPKLSQINPNLSQINPKLSQINPKLSQNNPNLSQINPGDVSGNSSSDDEEECSISDFNYLKQFEKKGYLLRHFLFLISNYNIQLPALSYFSFLINTCSCISYFDIFFICCQPCLTFS